MANGNGYTAEEVITAIKGSKGFVTQIAKRLGCTPRHVYNLLEKYQTAKDALFDEREGMKDFVEGMMYKRIEAGDTTMIIWFEKTQMKDRGYVERHELTGAPKSDGTPGPIEHRITGLEDMTDDALKHLID